MLYFLSDIKRHRATQNFFCWKKKPHTTQFDTRDVCWRMLTYADLCWRMHQYRHRDTQLAYSSRHLRHGLRLSAYEGRTHTGSERGSYFPFKREREREERGERREERRRERGKERGREGGREGERGDRRQERVRERERERERRSNAPISTSEHAWRAALSSEYIYI